MGLQFKKTIRDAGRETKTVVSQINDVIAACSNAQDHDQWKESEMAKDKD